MTFKTISTEPGHQQPHSTVRVLLHEYSLLLTEIDDWFNCCQKLHPDRIVCAGGCSACCRGLFDITILDAAYLKSGFERLSEDVKNIIRTRAEKQVRAVQLIWPEFNHPFTLNHRPEEERESLMASDNETPCLLLDGDGKCLLYNYRPMTCRLHGLPLIDLSGEVMESEWCSRNFTEYDPLDEENLRGPFYSLLHEEAVLGRDFTNELLGEIVCELDTFIPAALLIDFKGFDWHKWFATQIFKT